MLGWLCLGVVGGSRVKLIGCGLGSLWSYGLCEFCCVEDMVIV